MTPEEAERQARIAADGHQQGVDSTHEMRNRREGELLRFLLYVTALLAMLTVAAVLALDIGYGTETH